MRLAPRFLAVFVAAAACALWQAPAHAEIWGYVDAQGVAHFAAERLDARYELFFRGGESFDTAEGVAPPQPVREAPGPAAAKLAGFLQASPGYRQAEAHVNAAAREHGLELELLQALIAAESGFNPLAVSPKGAIGLMQVMPATAQRYGVSGDSKAPLEKKLMDPRTNLRTGARYLRDLIRMFPGKLELALAAYNAGEGAVQRAGNRIPNYRETQNYVRTVLQLYAVLKPARAAAVPAAQAPRRVRMELPGPTGATARRNLPPGVAAITSLEGPGGSAAVVHD
jgi:soluble lytic murein transglycosylase-like protein